MVVRPLTTTEEIRRAYDCLRKRLIEGATSYVRKIGYQGYREEKTGTPVVYWRPREAFWVCFNPVDHPTELLTQFGTEDPALLSSLSATVEVNSPKVDFDRRTAGAFVRTSNEHVFLAHSGRITVTRAKHEETRRFKEFCSGFEQAISCWPNGKESEMFLIGRIDDHRFPQRVAEYVSQVASFKKR